MKSTMPVLKHNPVTNKMILCDEEENPAWIEEEQAYLEREQAEGQRLFDAIQAFLEDHYPHACRNRDIEAIQNFIEEISFNNMISKGEAS